LPAGAGLLTIGPVKSSGGTEMTIKLVVDWPLCDGNGVCTIEAPDLLAIDDDDNLVVLAEDVPGSMVKQAEAAVRVCPKHALRLQR
jgi:ferredoxin